MLYPSQKKELLRGVCYFIDDSATYRCFALVSAYCAQLAHEYAPMKKMEFCRHVAQDSPMLMGYNVIHLLPNFRYHGHFQCYNSTGECMYCDMYDNGKRVWRWNSQTQVVERFVFTFIAIYHLLGKVDVLVSDQELSFQRDGKLGVVSNRCALCSRFHMFYTFGRRRILCLWKSCISTVKLQMMTLLYGSPILLRKGAIAKAVIEYAKRIKED